MKLNFYRNIAFTKLVKTNQRLHEFNFRRLPSDNSPLFHVDVSDDRGNRIMFRMQKDDGEWKIIDQQLPQWIWDSEKMLDEVIEHELQ